MKISNEQRATRMMNSDRIGFHIRTGGMHGGAALTLAMSR